MRAWGEFMNVTLEVYSHHFPLFINVELEKEIFYMTSFVMFLLAFKLLYYKGSRLTVKSLAVNNKDK
jgi:hypothetical protein